MSMTKKCDFCNKLEKTVKFSSTPFTLVLKNHSGEKYEVKADITMQHVSDVQAIKDFNLNRNGIAQDLVAKALMGGIDPATPVSELLKIKNPNPHICDNCKTVLIKYIANYCTPGKVEVF